ncbi:MAG: methyltransferase domain-containing protein [Thermoproteota archaeon]|nr:methyltransferase domain-containing protein [Thermoproteota archaeon]
MKRAGHAPYGHIFACTNKSEQECFDRMLFATNHVYGENVLKIKKGDILFLLNLDSDILYGTFLATSDGAKDIVAEAWEGRYPYQVKVSYKDKIHSIAGAKKILSNNKITWHSMLKSETAQSLSLYLNNPRDNLKIPLQDIDDDNNLRLETTTLWDHPRQNYGKYQKGSNKYAGVTPAFVIYNMIKRYTEQGDIVLDPMAGSGTTIDVCKEEGRRCIAYDISPTRPDIVQNDARKIPLADSSVEMVFVDSPYGDNINYNDHPDNVGRISAESYEFYEELGKVMAECYRVLKPGRVLGWLIGDQWVKKKFTPVGFRVYEELCKYFDTVDVVCVTRRSQTSNTAIWHSRALRFNFYLRGFKYLFIMRKSSIDRLPTKRKIRWTQYSRI